MSATKTILERMKVFVSAQAAKPASTSAQVAGIVYAGVLTLLALAQLYTFEKFIEILPSAVSSEGGVALYLLAPLIVVLEIFSLPYLLRLTVSPAFRFVSRVFGWLVPIFWVGIGILSGVAIENTGILGDVIAVAGLTTISMGLLLFAFTAYAHYLLSSKAAK